MAIPESSFRKRLIYHPNFFMKLKRDKKGFSVSVLFRMAKELLETCNYIVLGDNLDFLGGELREILNFFTVSQKKELTRIITAAYNWGRF